MSRKIRKMLGALCLVSIPLIGFAQAHNQKMVEIVTSIAGSGIHIE
jgi:hypothetical protein